jgi:FkbM family methyltransferase
MFKKLFFVFYNLVDNLIHQKRIVKFINKKNIKIVLDIGAHKGEFLKHIKKIETIRKVYSFEPQKKIYQELLKEIDNKKFFAHNFAFSDSNGSKKLQINDFTMTSTLSVINKKSSYYKIKNFIIGYKKEKFELIKTKTLDSFIKKKKLKKIDLLKIDTEGHEFQVIKSGLMTLKKTKYLLIEFRKNDLYENYSSSDLHDMIKKNKFKLIKIFKFPMFSMEDRLYKNKLFK